MKQWSGEIENNLYVLPSSDDSWYKFFPYRHERRQASKKIVLKFSNFLTMEMKRRYMYLRNEKLPLIAICRKWNLQAGTNQIILLCHQIKTIFKPYTTTGQIQLECDYQWRMRHFKLAIGWYLQTTITEIDDCQTNSYII